MTDKTTTTTTASNKPKAEAAPNPYPTLSKNFFRGAAQGQLTSLLRAADSSDGKAKIADAKKAMKAGDLKMTGEISSALAAKAKSAGIDLPNSVKVKEPRAAAPAAQ